MDRIGQLIRDLVHSVLFWTFLLFSAVLEVLLKSLQRWIYKE